MHSAALSQSKLPVHVGDAIPNATCCTEAVSCWPLYLRRAELVSSADSSSPTPESSRTEAQKHASRALHELVQSLLVHAVAQVFVWEEPAKRQDPDGVHQMRRATRQLRGTLRLLRPLLDRLWVRNLSDEVRWLAVELGAVRDLDVVNKLLRANCAHDDPQSGAFFELFDQRLERERQTLAAALTSARYAALRVKLLEAAEHPWLEADVSGRPRKLIARRVRAQWRRLRRIHALLKENPRDEELHELRKRGKDLRLSVQILAGLLGKRRRALAERFSRALSRLVASLGRCQDALVATQVAREISAELDPTLAQAPVLEAALQFQEESRREEAKQFDRFWKSLSKRARTGWMD